MKFKSTGDAATVIALTAALGEAFEKIDDNDVFSFDYENNVDGEFVFNVLSSNQTRGFTVVLETNFTGGRRMREFVVDSASSDMQKYGFEDGTDPTGCIAQVVEDCVRRLKED